MHQRVRQISQLAALSLLLCACGGSSGGAPPPPTLETRPFELGFTPWPYDATGDAVNFVYSEVVLRGDFIAHHLDGGVPWQEALDGTPYSTELDGEINARLVNSPPDMRTYLALSPLNGGRVGLADYWGTAPNQSLPPPWDTLSLDDPDVVTAYTNFATDLIGQFSPEYFNLGIEVSELAIIDSAAYDELVNFTEAVSGNLKAQFPSLQLMASVALKSPSSSAAATIRAELPRLIQHVDVVGVSVYPYILDARFIVWFSLVDYDALWDGVLRQDPVAQIWKDIGLYDESLNPRPALGTWMEQLAKPVE